jgi:hypothetical protein
MKQCKVVSVQEATTVVERRGFMPPGRGKAVRVLVEAQPTSSKIMIKGTISCEGCRTNFPFSVEAVKTFAGSGWIECSSCGCPYDLFAGWDYDTDGAIFVAAWPCGSKITVDEVLDLLT